MDKMYRIFVSSTYSDLIEERKQIIKTILRLGHYPICMEAFVATHGHQFDFIQSQLDTADIYLVILAKRYGSHMDDDRCGYTEREYEYAKQIGLPVLAFVCDKEKYKPSNSNCETEIQFQEQWDNFRDKLRHEKPCVIWENASDLISAIDASLHNLIEEGIEGWTQETKYSKFLRRRYDDEIRELQNEFNILISKTDTQRSFDSFLPLAYRLIGLNQAMQNNGLITRDRVRIKKIDFLFFHLKTKTIEWCLNPKPLYLYAQFLYGISDYFRAREEAITYLKVCSDEKDKIRTNILIGMIFWQMKDFSKSNGYLNYALNLFCSFYNVSDIDWLEDKILSEYVADRDEDNVRLLGELYNNLGLICDNTKKYTNAIFYYSKAVKCLDFLHKKNGKRFEYKYQLYLFNLASVQYKAADKAESIKNCKSCLDLLKNVDTSINRSRRLARTYHLFGDILLDDDRLSANRFYENALSLYQEIIFTQNHFLHINADKYKAEIAWCSHKMGEIYFKLGQYTRAVKVLTKAVEYREELFLSSHIQEHHVYMFHLAESEWLLSAILFNHYDKENRKQAATDAYKYADDAFFYFEQLFDKSPELYRQEYGAITKLSIEICRYFNDKNKIAYYEEKLNKVA